MLAIPDPFPRIALPEGFELKSMQDKEKSDHVPGSPGFTLAVLADIHANLTALDAVLQDMKQFKVGGIIAAGDHIGDGPQPAEVMRRLRELDACLIRGNREDYLLNYDGGMLPEWDGALQWSAMVWTYHQLGREMLHFLSSMPGQEVLVYPGMDSLRVVHGSPADSNELICVLSNPDKVRQVLSGIDETVMICAHSHEKWTYRTESKLAVNPGSVGVPFNSKRRAEYVLLHWNGETWEAEHRYVSYDLAELCRVYHASGFLDAGGAWARSVLASIKAGRNISMEFMDYVLRKVRESGMGEPEVIPNKIWEEADRNWDWEGSSFVVRGFIPG